MKNILKNRNVVVAGIAILLVAALFVFGGPGREPKVELEASLDKTSYTAEEDISISLNLKNTGKVETCVSDSAGETLVFNSITRNGEEVETRTVDANYIAPLPMLLEASLSPLPAGEGMDVVLSGEYDPGLDARALTTTKLEGDTGFVTFYNVEEAGDYELELVYQYPGPASEECESVFEGPSNSVKLNFTVSE